MFSSKIQLLRGAIVIEKMVKNAQKYSIQPTKKTTKLLFKKHKTKFVL